MYPPNPPTDGIYRVKLLSAEQDDAAYYIRYDISVGSCVGWATYIYQQTGKWPLIWRLDKRRGTTVIRCALDALHQWLRQCTIIGAGSRTSYMSGATSPDGHQIYRCKEIVASIRLSNYPRRHPYWYRRRVAAGRP